MPKNDDISQAVLTQLADSLAAQFPKQARKAIKRHLQRKEFDVLRADPIKYCNAILKINLVAKQQEAISGLLKPPYKVMAKSGHDVGKTYMAAAAVNFWYDAYDPGIVISTSCNETQVKDVLWKEIRVQRKAAGLGGFRGDKMPRLESSADHWAHGFTAESSDAFQGRHAEHVLIVFDEANGVDPKFWVAAQTMFTGEGCAWLAILNPTDTTSQAYREDASGTWRVISISCLDHPNIAHDLRYAKVVKLDNASNDPHLKDLESLGWVPEGSRSVCRLIIPDGIPRPPVPGAIRLSALDEMLRKWCAPVSKNDARATDVEWPPGSDYWLRPGPMAEARLLGRWPSAGTYGVWSDADWQAATTHRQTIPAGTLPQIGCDVARFGDDNTEIHVRRGPCSIHHEFANGWSTSETAGRLKKLANELCHVVNAERKGHEPHKPQDIPIMIDDDGVGGGVVDQAGGYKFIPISSSRKSSNVLDYPTVRSELWFKSVDQARMGLLDLTRLPDEVVNQLKMQAMAPTWSMDASGRRVVETKEITKEKIGRSPDGMDAVNLAYCSSNFKVGASFDRAHAKSIIELSRAWDSAADRRGLWGRR